jgi:hypothetical protein
VKRYFWLRVAGPIAEFVRIGRQLFRIDHCLGIVGAWLLAACAPVALPQLPEAEAKAVSVQAVEVVEPEGGHLQHLRAAGGVEDGRQLVQAEVRSGQVHSMPPRTIISTPRLPTSGGIVFRSLPLGNTAVCSGSIRG